MAEFYCINERWSDEISGQKKFSEMFQKTAIQCCENVPHPVSKETWGRFTENLVRGSKVGSDSKSWSPSMVQRAQHKAC